MSGDELTKIVIELDEEWETKEKEYTDDVLHISVSTQYQLNMFYNAVHGAMARIGLMD